MCDYKALLQELTLEEKCALLSGAETFKTRGMPKHGIPQMWLSDGPHGLRKQAGESDHLGLNPSVPATCFPTASAVANSWDTARGCTSATATLPQRKRLCAFRLAMA